MGIYVKFTMTDHQIWLCHIKIGLKFKKNDFSPNSILNFRKGYKMWGNWLKNKKVTGKKTNWGWKTPIAHRVKNVDEDYIRTNSLLQNQHL